MHFQLLASWVGLGVLGACSSGATSGSDPNSGGRALQAGAGGFVAGGGSFSAGNTSGGAAAGGAGGEPAQGGSALGGAGTGGAALGGAGATAGVANGGIAGAGAQTVCGSAGLACLRDELCVENVFYPNNIDPNNVLPPSTSWVCKTNPCGSAPLSCECARSVCNYPECHVTSSTKLQCVFAAVCASPETRIATPNGERAIAELSPGDLVYSADGRSLRPVPILRVAKTAVRDHRVVELETVDGSVMEISSGHPTADGRSFGELRAGDELDGVLIVASRLIEYRFSHTYDILPASDTGTYVAFGKLIGSTLK